MPKTMREKQRELREKEILDTACQLLLEQGFQKMNMDELAARVGIAKMTIYQHFSSKEELAVRIIVREMRMIEEEFASVFALECPALERLEQLLLKSFAFRSINRRVNMELSPVVIIQNPEYQAQRDRLAAQWAQLIEQAKREGAVDPSLSTPVLVRTLFHAFQADYDDLIKSGLASSEELTHTFVTVVLKGMSLSPGSRV
ncbi:TetR/AcrR family transcriptional regulator [Tengunoibacter tsumagoiensis]|uniref:TetR family transcriptional regulator n=1 Tax=Tengunoibacter tsumagoiensis TaxID=2014871 RepID=A0A402A6P4_9CHLR|nr:TetR/AcrR family transcriptional regulator [Tengunoibacter tsumagoiensis]GCE14813.1 TetR family transcriptional regulator [Tengunoibacter tsumagoiensis]